MEIKYLNNLEVNTSPPIEIFILMFYYDFISYKICFRLFVIHTNEEIFRYLSVWLAKSAISGLASTKLKSFVKIVQG